MLKNSSFRFREPRPMLVQSNGMGQQSVAMYYLSCLGFLPRFDYSIFVDLGNEKPGTYEALHYMQNWAFRNNGIPIIVLRDKNLMHDTLSVVDDPDSRFVSLPFFSCDSDGTIGILRRQCTSDYKIRQINACIKWLYGLSGNQRFPETYVYIGITFDELNRISSPEPVKFTNVYPFVNVQRGYKNAFLSSNDPYGKQWSWSRFHCVEWLTNNDFPVPPTSSCLFCPYTSDADWLDMKLNDTESFEIACTFDDKIRHLKPGVLNSNMYLHRSGIPLREVVFKSESTGTLFDCEGHCHI